MTLKGNHDMFPTRPDGTRDLLRSRSHVETYKDMENLLDTGKVKAIGVANYSLRYLKELLSKCSVPPAVNQIENHILLPQQEIVDFCREKSIHVTAYSPLGSSGSPLMQLSVIKTLAKCKDVSPAVLLLSWHGTSQLSPCLHISGRGLYLINDLFFSVLWTFCTG